MLESGIIKSDIGEVEKRRERSVIEVVVYSPMRYLVDPRNALESLRPISFNSSKQAVFVYQAKGQGRCQQFKALYMRRRHSHVSLYE
jgi:hypothetical protein